MQADSRQGARKRAMMAVGVTGGGAALLAGTLVVRGVDDPAGGGLPAARVAVKAPARLVVQAPEGTEVRPDQPVSVTVHDGKVVKLALTDDNGTAVPGTYTRAGAWQATERLRYGTRYALTAAAVGEDGQTRKLDRTFTTLTPKKLLGDDVTPYGMTTMGVGVPIIVRFDSPVTKPAEVERHLKVTTSKPVNGRWRWVNDDEVQYRPEKYWPAYTDVRVDLDLQGVETADGVWGKRSRNVRFRIGPRMISKVDARTLRMKVWRDGKPLRSMRVTTGRAGYATRSGIRVISEKRPGIEMNSTDRRPGQPGYYAIFVRDALRISDTGEFVHGAPWSVGSQGRSRVSHGCVGLSPKNASWFFRNSNVGDVVEVVNTGRGLEPGNGWTQWNTSWARWKAGSAL